VRDRMEKYKFIDDLTSDVLFEAYGKDLKEVFLNAAEALMSVICQPGKTKPEKPIEAEVEGKNPGELMHNWLQELIARVDIEVMFFSKFEILEISEKHLKARIWGEEADPAKGETVVKAVTYYKYKFEKTPEGFLVRASLDI